MTPHNASAPLAQDKNPPFKSCSIHDFVAMVYTLGEEPLHALHPDGTRTGDLLRQILKAQPPKIGLTLHRRLAFPWSKIRPGTPLIVFGGPNSFLHAARMLESVAINITRILEPGRTVEQTLAEYENFVRERVSALEAVH